MTQDVSVCLATMPGNSQGPARPAATQPAGTVGPSGRPWPGTQLSRTGSVPLPDQQASLNTWDSSLMALQPL